MNGERLDRLREVPREDHHPLIGEVRSEEGLHPGTLFYVKEYGSGRSVTRTVLRESLPILVVASLFSSLGGGLALEHSKETLFALSPFIVLLPAMNDMIGDFGIIVSSRVAEHVYRDELRTAWWRDPEIHRLFAQVVSAALLSAVFVAVLALAITATRGDVATASFAVTVVGIVLLDTLILTTTVFVLAVLAGLATFKRGTDPNNVLIPITTSVADVLNVLLLTTLVVLLV